MTLAAERVEQARPTFAWSDVLRAPLHDYPIRDEILFQYLSLPSTAQVLELGPGSGFTAFRLSRHVEHVTLVDVAPRAVGELRQSFRRVPNIEVVCADVSRPGLARRLARDFDVAFGLDMIEYVSNPRICLKNVAEVLRPNGELLLTLPNVPPPIGDGITYFANRSDLEDLLAGAGFGKWAIFAVKLRPWSALVHRALHDAPLAAYRMMRVRPTTKPQIYEDTWAFRQRARLGALKTPLHLYWTLLGALLSVGGDAFASQELGEQLYGYQLVIQAKR
jgi:SAM-dependent methyltransferase